MLLKIVHKERAYTLPRGKKTQTDRGDLTLIVYHLCAFALEYVQVMVVFVRKNMDLKKDGKISKRALVVPWPAVAKKLFTANQSSTGAIGCVVQ